MNLPVEVVVTVVVESVAEVTTVVVDAVTVLVMSQG